MSIMATTSTSESKEQVRRPPPFPVFNLKGDFCKELPYTLDSLLAAGKFSNVFVVTSRDNPDVKLAVKVMSLTGKNNDTFTKKMFDNEVYALYNTDHRSVAKCFLAARCPDYLAIAMKFYPQGNLFDCLPILSPFDKPELVGRLCEAVAYLHHKRIVHGDIKLSNVLMDRGVLPVLADFGHSCYVPKDVLSLPADDFGGTEPYWAPELRGRGCDLLVDPFKVDIYALGVVILSVLANAYPTLGADYQHMLHSIEDISFNQRCMLKRMLEPDFRKRCESLEMMTYYSNRGYMLFSSR